jgi:hypothetical protein
LSPRFIGPFKILERKGEVAYQLELPAQLSDVHDVFHVAQLEKCSSEIKVDHLPLKDHDVKDDSTYKEHPIKILDTSQRITRRRVITMCKVQWSHHSEEGATWEEKMSLSQNFLSSFPIVLNLEDEILFKGVGFVTPKIPSPKKF